MSEKIHVNATLNGDAIDFLCEPRQSLLEVLRDVLYLTGTKEGCNDGNCGSCSVTLDGVLVNACCVLGVEVNGKAVATIEGMAQNGEMHPLQTGFHEEHGLQCGFCTPGMVMVAADLLTNNPNPSEDEIRQALEGNYCRCTGYHNIIRSIKHAAERMQAATA